MRPRVLLAAILTAILAVAAAACGGGFSSGGDTARGKELFVKGDGDPGEPTCGSCHTLADAGTLGTIGPNLDDAFASDRAQGFDASSIQQVVAGQIRHPLRGRPGGVTPTGTPVMPGDLVTGSDVDAIAAYVASVAGLPVKKPPGGGQAGGGKDIFKSACSGCHTLADAQTTGTVGPNLDQAKPPRSLVVDRVTNGKGNMPSFKGQLTPKQIEDVADYVSSAAGK